MLGMTRTLDASTTFEDALARIPEALKTEGFGVLTRIDVRETLKARLGVEFRPYVILGACNPTLAHRALGQDLSVGVMLPCNVAVYVDDAGRTVVEAIDPLRTMAAQGSPALAAIAEEVREKLARVLERIA